MIDSVMLSKERLEEPRPEPAAEDSEYYYDDSTGYRVYKPENENDEDEDEEDDREEE